LKTVKKVSFTLLTLPILFSGCATNKQATLITPKNLKITKQTTQFHLTKLDKEKIQKKIKTLDVPTSVLDTLALQVMENYQMDLGGDPTLTTTALQVDENWLEITKNDELIETAKEFLGTKYIWAANGPSSFDCSGYTRYIFKKYGVSLPRYSGYQANVGIRVNFDELEKGDLVFFDTEKHPKNKVNHVGIYIGNGKFIHASSAKKQVTITSFNKKKFYKHRFLHGQRVLNATTNVAWNKNKQENQKVN
jgi:uncharacterized protein YceK